MGSQVGGTKGSTGKALPDSALINIEITAGTARALLGARAAGRPLTGPAVNPLIMKLSQALIAPSNGKGGKGGKGDGGKTNARPGP